MKTKQPKKRPVAGTSMRSTNPKLENKPIQGKPQAVKRQRLANAKPKPIPKRTKTHMDWDSSKDDPLFLDLLQTITGEEPSVTTGASDDDSSRTPDEPAPSDPPMPTLEDPPGAIMLTASTNPNPKAPPKRTKTQTKKEKEMNVEIRHLITETGTQHVYFGRGEPFTNNPGNIRFRSIVDKYCLEYRRASTRALQREIREWIVGEVKINGSKFFDVVVTINGNVSQKPADVEQVLTKTDHALRDTPKRRANLWSWADPAQEQLSWSNYSNKDGTALEKMFEKDKDHRTEVPVSIRQVKHLVDVSSMIMHRVDAHGNKNFTDLRVCRKDPEEEMDDGESIFESFENYVHQYEGNIDSLDLWMSTLVIPDAPGAPMQNSDFNPFSSDPRLSHAAPAPMKTMPRNGMPGCLHL
jgi:hypothetical protein